MNVKLGDVVELDDGRVGVVSRLMFANMVWVEYALEGDFCWGIGAESLERYRGELTPELKALKARYRPQPTRNP